MVTPHGSPLDDRVLADEIELVGNLLAAAAASDGRLTGDEIDEALGLGPRRSPRGAWGRSPDERPGASI